MTVGRWRPAAAPRMRMVAIPANAPARRAGEFSDNPSKFPNACQHVISPLSRLRRAVLKLGDFAGELADHEGNAPAHTFLKGRAGAVPGAALWAGLAGSVEKAGLRIGWAKAVEDYRTPRRFAHAADWGLAPPIGPAPAESK